MFFPDSIAMLFVCLQDTTLEEKTFYQLNFYVNNMGKLLFDFGKNFWVN